jgi:hypothetical protein
MYKDKNFGEYLKATRNYNFSMNKNQIDQLLNSY